MLENEQVKEYFDKHPEAVEIIEDFDFQIECWRPEFGNDTSLYYRKAAIDDVKYISFGGWFGESGVYAWLYPCGVPTYVWVGDTPKPCDAVVFRMMYDPDEAYREFKHEMYDHEYSYDPNDWEVLRIFGSCPDGYDPNDWMRAWGYSDEVIAAYWNASKDVLKENGWE
jgi:hypothetical protein